MQELPEQSLNRCNCERCCPSIVIYREHSESLYNANANSGRREKKRKIAPPPWERCKQKNRE